MAKRKAASTAGKRSRSQLGPRREKSVSFVGTAIDAAILRIRLRARKLPPKGRAAAGQAVKALRECREEIKNDICHLWEPKD